MDLLTDLFREAGLRRRLLDLRALSPACALRFPCERSFGLHVVTSGTLFLHAASVGEPVALHAGDVAVMARGSHHVLATAASLDGLPIETVAATFADDMAEAPVPRHATCSVISGAYQLWNTPVHPFFSQLPEWFVLRADEVPRLGPLALTLGMLDDEVRRRDLGADTVVHGLLDVIFGLLLREIVRRQGDAGAGWSCAVRDPQVRRAVSLMHDDCARPWTLESLGAAVGLSRTTLAERFRSAMGDTPLAYLRTVRMQKAMRLLAETDKHLEAVATEVGYQDAFGFSKVFKRTVGVTPKAFRHADAESRTLPWRVNER